jgi:hypothetical protein
MTALARKFQKSTMMTFPGEHMPAPFTLKGAYAIEDNAFCAVPFFMFAHSNSTSARPMMGIN